VGIVLAGNIGLTVLCSTQAYKSTLANLTLRDEQNYIVKAKHCNFLTLGEMKVFVVVGDNQHCTSTLSWRE